MRQAILVVAALLTLFWVEACRTAPPNRAGKTDIRNPGISSRPYLMGNTTQLSNLDWSGAGDRHLMSKLAEYMELAVVFAHVQTQWTSGIPVAAVTLIACRYVYRRLDALDESGPSRGFVDSADQSTERVSE